MAMLNPLGVEGSILRVLQAATQTISASTHSIAKLTAAAQTDVAGSSTTDQLQRAAEGVAPAALAPEVVAVLAFVAALVGALVGAAIVRRIRSA
jgi:uncharacterized protein YybS (DUF2232 family)